VSSDQPTQVIKRIFDDTKPHISPNVTIVDVTLIAAKPAWNMKDLAKQHAPTSSVHCRARTSQQRLRAQVSNLRKQTSISTTSLRPILPGSIDASVVLRHDWCSGDLPSHDACI
jgi:prephenate dehydrogenase